MNSNNNELLMDGIKGTLHELCINIKKSLSSTEINELTNNQNKEDDSSKDLNILINNIKTYINFILHEKNNYNESIRQLESYIRKLEEDIKFHIRIQYQNKIYRDSLEGKLRAYIKIEEDYEELKEKVKFEDGKFMENDRKDNEINILRRENSNLKKEIAKMKKKFVKIFELEEKNKNLEEVHNNDEENIQNLNIKIDQLNNKIAEMEKQLNTPKDVNNQKEIHIHDNNYNNINLISTRILIDKYNTKSTENNSKKGENIYRKAFNIFNNDSRNIKSRTTKMMKNYKSLYKSNTYNKLTQEKNSFLRDTSKKKSDSITMRKEEKDNSELFNKYIKNIEKNKIKNILRNKLNIYENNIRRKLSKEKKNNNIIYEHSALNILGIHGKYKI